MLLPYLAPISMIRDIEQVDVDLAGIATSAKLHSRLASTFGFPDHYGRNWDAFDECIAECGPTSGTLKIRGWDELKIRLPRDAKLLRSCLDDFAQGVSIRVVWDY